MVAGAARRELGAHRAVSLINKMLQELDRRNALGSPGGSVPPQQVRAVSAPGAGREWFWRTLALLALIAIGWVGWVTYQVRPLPLATELALNAGEEARRKTAMTAAKKSAPPDQPAAAPVAQAEAPAPAPAPPAAAKETTAPRAEAQPSPPPPELFKLALSIDRPIPERVAKLAAKPPIAASAAPGAGSPGGQKQAGADAGASRVSKREIPRSPAEEAEALFRHGVAFLNQGRVGAAQQNFAAALAKHSGHEAARQALIAILIERRQLEDARQLLEEGLSLNPAQMTFAAVLARVLVERGDYREAANVLGATRNAAAGDAEYQLLYGAVLQRLGRHAEAVEAFERAARIANQPGVIWVALGISLEAVGNRAGALQAYRLSLGAGPVAQDARAYAESRIRALD